MSAKPNRAKCRNCGEMNEFINGQRPETCGRCKRDLFPKAPVTVKDTKE